MTFDLVGAVKFVPILKECCMAFANMLSLFLLGERIVAHGHLVIFSVC